MNVKYIYLRMLIAILKKLNYHFTDKIIIAVDSKLGSWRRNLVKDYKANRKDNRERLESKEWWNQVYKEIDEIVEILKSNLPILVIEEDYCEADDIIAVCCKMTEDRDIIICSSDSDLEQLAVYPNVFIFSIITKKIKDIKDPLSVLRNKIFQGDKADNILEPNKIDIELRRKIFNLLYLPLDIETRIRNKLQTSVYVNNINIENIPYRTIKQDLYKLFVME